MASRTNEIRFGAVAWKSHYPSRRLVKFGQDAQATLHSGEKPDKLRGPEHHVAWVDELISRDG